MQLTYNYQNQSEQHLVAEGQAGNAAAIGELFERYQHSSLHLARRILTKECEAEDAVQSAYCSAFSHFENFRREASFKTWLHRIVVNCCLVTLRQRWHKISIDTSHYLATAKLEDFSSPMQSPEKAAWWSQVATAHEKAIAQLPATMRKAYLLYAHAEMPIAQIAVELGLSLPAAKTRVFRARNAVRTSIEKMWFMERTHA